MIISLFMYIIDETTFNIIDPNNMSKILILYCIRILNNFM